MHNHLLEFVNEHNLISENQIGFRGQSRTSDHIFTLKSIIENFKTQKKKVYAAFIDLRKTFDTVWREGLFYKMLIAGISTKVFQITYSMYQDTKRRIKFSNGVSNEFSSTCGVKRRDVSSPLLFNLFIDDLVKKLKISNCDPVVIKNISVNSLLYADDIILLSSSDKGLQKSLDIVDKFCTDWKLDVSYEKSKVTVFSSNGKSHLNKFKYQDCVLETVKSNCYLDATIKYSGSIDDSSNLLMEKGRKAFFKIKTSVWLNNPCSLLESFLIL